jgi:four helix bundle protein
MATFRKFEEINAWKKARIVTQKVYELTRHTDFSKDFGLKDQSTRAAVSIMANIAEGHGRRTAKDFAYFLGVARGSAIELQALFYAAFDQEYVNQEEFCDLYYDLEEVSKMTVSLARYLRNSK